MGEYKKKLPIIEEDTREFWQGCKDRKLLLPKCKSCRGYHFPPSSLCPHCMSGDLEWVESKGRGKIYTYTVYHQAFAFDPSWKDDIPYTVAVIELEEGIRMMAHLKDCSPEEVAIGKEVELCFEEATPEITLPRFRLSEGE